MNSLYTKETSLEFIARINKLNESTPAIWGKMNVSQMLAHCQKPLEIANGSLSAKPNRIIRFLFAKTAKKQLIHDSGFKKNLPTFTEAKVTDLRSFEIEKSKLIALIEKFQNNGTAGIAVKIHPFFGDMSYSDWDILMVKHLDHHLKQFGV